MEDACWPLITSHFDNVVISLGSADDLAKLPRNGYLRFTRYAPDDLSGQNITVILPAGTYGQAQLAADEIFLCDLSRARTVTVAGYEQAQGNKTAQEHAFAEKMLRRAIALAPKDGMGRAGLRPHSATNTVTKLEATHVKFVTVSEYVAVLGDYEFGLEKWGIDKLGRQFGRRGRSWRQGDGGWVRTPVGV